MTATKTNEREGTRAVLRHSRVSAYKVRAVLDLIRGKDVQQAREALQFSERDAAQLVGKVLASAVANAENNDGLDPESLYVSACYADEGTTMKRWRPRARGRATRIRKRTCHVTVIVSRLPDEQLARVEARHAGDAARRARRVAGGRQGRRARREEQPRGEPRQESTGGADLIREESETTSETTSGREGGGQ
ncbi:MAG: 50S ribosomal protein L22 [Actinomycetota bacterium]|nr:50S ribosomal protein L22 [Actinomycetota bacterium]MDQ3680825.1 50S ribosomal protein L22 [Actinomycetota bacterium]